MRSTGRTVVMYSKNFGQGLIALAAFLSSCCSPSSEDRYALPEFDNVSDSKVEIISEELFGINRVSDIFVMEDHVVVGAYNAEDNTVLQVFDREGAELCHAVQYGRGPKEVLSMLNLWSDKGKGVVGIVDQNQNKEVYVDIDRLLEEGPVSITEEGVTLPSWFQEMRPVPATGRKVVIRNISPIKDTAGFYRITVEDSTGSITGRSRSYPLPDRDKCFIIYNEAMTSVSPDGEKMAVGTLWGGILEIYSLRDGIELKDVEYFIEPDFIAHSGYGEMTENTRFGFIDIDVTDDLIYTVIDGETYPLRSQGDFSKDEKQHGNNISIFDWNGQPVRKIMTDYEIKKLCVDEESQVAYTVVVDSLKRPFLGRINIGN